MTFELTPLLVAIALGLLGIDTGISVSALIHDHRIADLSASQYAAMHQMRDKSFRRVMPVLRLTTIGMLVASAFAMAGLVPRVLAIAAALLMAAEVVLTVRRLVPLNERVQSWTEATIPADWAQTRDRWADQHRIRLALGFSAYTCFLAAMLSAASAF